MSLRPQKPTKSQLGLKLLAGFFAFGVLACSITVTALLFPGPMIDQVWRLNPEAQRGFRQLGASWSILLMSVVGVGCGFAAYGLARRRDWGRRLAIAILAVNLVGDSANALLRGDLRTLVGLPIGGAMIIYLWRQPGKRAQAAG